MSPQPGSGDESSSTAIGTSGEGGAGGPAGAAQPQVINLMGLPIPQLQQLKQQFDQDLQFYQEAIMSLKDVQIKMTESGNALKLITNQKKEILVPVTNSMYVKGEIEDTNSVLVDIGTGYYIDKSLEDAKDYFNRKVEFLTEQIEKVQGVGREKSTIRNAIIDVLEQRLKEAMQKNAQAQSAQT